jgi:hypothetical protein
MPIARADDDSVMVDVTKSRAVKIVKIDEVKTDKRRLCGMSPLAKYQNQESKAFNHGYPPYTIQ